MILCDFKCSRASAGIADHNNHFSAKTYIQNIPPNAISIIMELCSPNTPRPVKPSRALGCTAFNWAFSICPLKAFLGISIHSFIYLYIHSFIHGNSALHNVSAILKTLPQQSYFNLFDDYRHCYDSREALTLGHYAMEFTADQTAWNAHQQPDYKTAK